MQKYAGYNSVIGVIARGVAIRCITYHYCSLLGCGIGGNDTLAALGGTMPSNV